MDFHLARRYVSPSRFGGDAYHLCHLRRHGYCHCIRSRPVSHAVSPHRRYDYGHEAPHRSNCIMREAALLSLDPSCAPPRSRYWVSLECVHLSRISNSTCCSTNIHQCIRSCYRPTMDTPPLRNAKACNVVNSLSISKSESTLPGGGYGPTGRSNAMYRLPDVSQYIRNC